MSTYTPPLDISRGDSPEDRLGSIGHQLRAIESEIMSMRRQRASLTQDILNTTSSLSTGEISEATMAQVNQLNRMESELVKQQEQLREERDILRRDQQRVSAASSWQPPEYRYFLFDTSSVPSSTATVASWQSSAPEPEPEPKPDPTSLMMRRKVAKHPMVEEITLDKRKRIIITTKPVYIQKKTWKNKKRAGAYQIRIDFTKGWYKGIDIINKDRHYDTVHHPCVDGEVCWGTIAHEVESHFDAKDLVELVIDCIDFIQSPNDKNGFLDSGWMTFFFKARKQPYSFALLDGTEDRDVPF